MKTSFITTVFNEEKSIAEFLDSIVSQTQKPDEVIIVDGASTDRSLEIINSYSKKIKNLKIFSKKGNISVGRNFAILKSKNEIILCSDAGCTLDKNWVKEMVSSFDRNISIVSGFYKPVSKNIFQKCLSTYTSVMPDRINRENFLPSSRSVGFRKSSWKKVGGYPKWLDTCEDLFFARELDRYGFKFKFNQKALVYWPQRENLAESFIQFFRYARGDGKARYIRKSTPFLFVRYIVGFSLLVLAVILSDNLYILILLLLFGYILWSIQKNYKYIKNWKAFIYLPLLQFTSDIAVISGMSVGFVNSFGIKK